VASGPALAGSPVGPFARVATLQPVALAVVALAGAGVAMPAGGGRLPGYGTIAAHPPGMALWRNGLRTRGAFIVPCGAVKMPDRAILATLAADPSRIDDFPAADLPGLIGEAEALRARLLARLMTMATAPAEPIRTDRTNGPDRLLTAEEVASRLGLKDRRAVYRRADGWPFTRRLGNGTLRFSEKGLEKWQARR
jgi:predicted DNA-binding transcriptional regulator AlpA